VTPLIGLGISLSSVTTSFSEKRKGDKRLDKGIRQKRSKSDSGYASGTNVHIKEDELDVIGAYSI
jgi:hypothetical protein